MRRLLVPILAMTLIVAACQGSPATAPSESAAATSSGSSAASESAAASPTSPGGTLKVGYAAALTGGLAPYDQPAVEGIKLAVAEINKAGGIAGKYPIELTVRDMKSDAAVATQVTQSLLDDGNKVIITICDADGSIASGKVAQAAGVPAISTCASPPTIPPAVGNVMFLTAVGDNAQAAALADEAVTLGYKTAYLLGSPDTGYTKQLPVYFKEAFTKRGGTVVGQDNFSIGAADFGPQVTRIKALNPAPDFIMTPAYVPDSSTFMKQLRQAGVTIPVLTTDGNSIPDFLTAAGSAAEGTVLTSYGFPTPGSPLETFNQLYQQRTGKVADTVYIAIGWDTIQVIAAAVAKADSLDPAQIRSAMENLQNVQGAIGPISYTPDNHVPLRTVAVEKVVNGAFQFVSQEVPTDIPAP